MGMQLNQMIISENMVYLNKTFTTTTTIGGALQYDTFKNLYNREHQISMGLSYDQAKSYYRSGGFLGILITKELLNHFTIARPTN